MVLGLMHLENLVAGRSVDWVLLQQLLNHEVEVLRVLRWQGWVNALDNFLVESIHVIGPEGRIQCTHFIEDTTYTPEVAL